MFEQFSTELSPFSAGAEEGRYQHRAAWGDAVMPLLSSEEGSGSFAMWLLPPVPSSAVSAEPLLAPEHSAVVG